MGTSQVDPTDNSPTNSSTDEEVMRLFLQHQPMLFVFLHSILNDWEDAEEALQETSIVLWRKREQFVPGTSFVNWAMTIAQYQAHRFLRGRKHVPRVFGEQLLEQMT